MLKHFQTYNPVEIFSCHRQVACVSENMRFCAIEVRAGSRVVEGYVADFRR